MPSIRRIVVSVVITAIVVAVLFPDVLNFLSATHPIEDGSVMLFQVDEKTRKVEQRYGVKLRFKKQEDGTFRLDVMSPHGVRSLNLTDELEPVADVKQDPFEFPTAEGSVHIQPGLIWLPKDRREAGKNCLTGLVMGVDGFGQWQTWQVMHPDGLVHFEVETGLLAGFELTVGLTQIKARLRALR